MSFKDFKKKQHKLTDAISKMAETPKRSYQDDRVWNVQKDSAGNGNATIRFLPQKDLEKSPIILTFRHAFQTAGKWFIEDCPVTVGAECPVCEHSASMWDSDSDQARKLWRKKTYIANILVVEDSNNPENEGKVFLFKFGQSIYDIIMGVVAPEDDDEESVNIFDFDEGLNFKLKMVQKGGYNNYDKSKFVMGAKSVADGDESEQERIYNDIYDLSEFTQKDKFKSYEELLKKFSSMTSVSSSMASNIEEEDKKKETTKKDSSNSDIPFGTDEEKSDGDDGDDDDDDIDFDALLADD